MKLPQELVIRILGELGDMDRFNLRFTAVGRLLGLPRAGEHVVALLAHVMVFKTLAVRILVAGVDGKRRILIVAPRLNKPKRFKIWQAGHTPWPDATDLTLQHCFERIIQQGRPTNAFLRTNPQLPMGVQMKMLAAGHKFATRTF